MLNKAMVFFLGVSLSLSGISGAQSLKTPFTAENLNTNPGHFDAFVAKKLIEGAELWRRGAVENLENSESGKADFLVVVKGVRIKIQDHYPVEDYLGYLNDERLSALLTESISTDVHSRESLFGRKKIAETILRRTSLSSRFAEAQYQIALVNCLTARKRDDGIAAFDALAGGDGIYAQKAQSARRALSVPKTVMDFQVTRELLDMTTAYGNRHQGLWLCTPSIKIFKEHGAEFFDPGNFSSSDVPLLTVTRALFEVARTEELSELVTFSEELDDLSEESLIQIRYWAGMNAYAGGMEDRAIPLFQKNIDTQSISSFTAYSSLRLGEVYLAKKDWLKAAAVFEVTAEDYQSTPEVPGLALRKKEFLFNSGLIDRSVYDSNAGRIKNDLRQKTGAIAEGTI